MHYNRIDQTKATDSGLENLRSQVAALERCLSEIKAELWPEPPTISASADFQLDEQMIRRVLKARRLREKLLGADLFADPAWDILLEALATELGQGQTSVSGLCHASNVPPTTSLRWVKKLEQEGWLLRIADPLDGRRHWMALTAEGSASVRRYFAFIWPNMLPA